MSHRVNVMLDEPIWRILQQYPKGERSRIVNAAISEWERSRRRREAAQRMDRLRTSLPQVTTKEIVADLRRDREREK